MIPDTRYRIDFRHPAVRGFEFDVREPVPHAPWYRLAEQPDMTGQRFHAADDFVIASIDMARRCGSKNQ